MKTGKYSRFLKENPDRIAPEPKPGALFGEVVRRLRNQPEPKAPPIDEFADRVMARVRREETAAAQGGGAWGQRMRGAGTLAAGLMIGVWVGAVAWGLWSRHDHGTNQTASANATTLARTAAMQILLAEQTTDGRWQAGGKEADALEVHGGELQASQDGALTAMALLALIRSDAEPLHGPNAAAIRAGMERLAAMQRTPRGLGDCATRGGQVAHYLTAMALQSGAALSGAEASWREAAAQAAEKSPNAEQVARLNRHLAQPGHLPEPWKKAGGPVLMAAMELLQPQPL